MILAVDCGSTYLKAALFASPSCRLAEVREPFRYSRRDRIHAEFTVAWLNGAFDRMVRRLSREAGQPLSAVRVLAFASQAQTFTLLDAAGRPLRPFLSWLDERAAEEADALADRFGADFHRHCSFDRPMAALAIAKLLWIRRHQPAVWRRARRWISMPGWLGYRAAGVNLIDPNLAALSGLYSLQTKGWRQPVAAFLDFPRTGFPELWPTGRRRTGPGNGPWSGRPLTLVSAGNDHTAAAVGNGCRRNEVMATFGTALVAYRRTGARPGSDSTGCCWGPYPGGGYYALAASRYGGSALDWARAILRPDSDAAAFDRLAAAAPPGSHGVLFVPEQTGTPEAWQGAAGTPADRARAVLEGILFSLRRLIGEVLQAAPADVCALGGGSASRFWMAMAASVLGCPVRVGSGDALAGAAALAAGGADRLAPACRARFQPDPALAARYDRVYRAWRRVCGRG